MTATIVLPLLAPVPRGQHHQSETRRLFVHELKQLQPTAGYMRLVKELVLRSWQERKSEVGREASDTERRAKAIQQKLDRLDEAFLFAQSIDITTYERQRDRLRQELTLTDIDRHSAAVEKIDVEGILAFAERVTERVGLVGAGVA